MRLLLAFLLAASIASAAPKVEDMRTGRHSPTLYGEWFGHDLLLEEGATIEGLVSASVAQVYPDGRVAVEVLWIGPEAVAKKPAVLQVGHIRVMVGTAKGKVPVSVTSKCYLFKPTDADFRKMLEAMLTDLRRSLQVARAIRGC